MNNLEIISSKIFTPENLLRQCEIWRFKGKKIVFSNGCFDILHLGHIEYLAKSRDFGDVLVIGLNSDRSVRSIKGPGRPVNNERSRAMALAALSFVTVVVLFDEDTPLELIRMIQPDILVKGKDYAPDQIVGADLVTARGGEIRTVELTEGYSTTTLLEKIRETEKTS